MNQQLFDIYSIWWVFSQTFVQKVPPFSRDKDIGWDADLILYYLDELLLFGDLEGILTY